MANALLVGERRSRITLAETARFLAILATFPITVDDETVAHAWLDTVHLARAQNLSSYDAAYLELARRNGVGLITLDRDLADAAAAEGIPVQSPGRSTASQSRKRYSARAA